MNPSDRLHCPDCRGRLSAVLAREMRCSNCARSVALVGGIVDFVGERLPLPRGADRYRCRTRVAGLASDLPTRIKSAAGSRWPAGLGDAIEFGCGVGSTAESVVSGKTVRSLLVDTDVSTLQACPSRIADLNTACPVLCSLCRTGGTTKQSVWLWRRSLPSDTPATGLGLRDAGLS